MIKKNILTLSYSDIDDLLDEHVINEEPFVFMVDADIAEYIEIYLYDEFNIEDDEAPDSYDYDDVEYLVSYLPPCGDDTYHFFIEEARTDTGKIKFCDLGKAYYYAFGEVEFNETRQAFGQEGLLMFCELEECMDDEDIDYEDCDCCDDIENELTDEQEEELLLIADYLKKILEANGCPECTFETLVELSYAFRNIGFRDCKDYVQSCVDDID